MTVKSAAPPMLAPDGAPHVRYIRSILQDMPPKFDPPTDGFLRSQGHDTSRLRPMGLNECLFPPSPKILDAIRAALGSINRYPDAQCPDVGKIISARTGIGMDRIVWGNGSEELIKGAIELSTSRGDHVVLPAPTFWGYRAMLRAAEVKTTFVDLKPDGAIDVDALLRAVTSQTKLVFCITPNNPSGAMLSAEEMERIAQSTPDDTLLFVDEAYHEFGIHAGGPDIIGILQHRKGPWIIARTFSKAYAMAGMRIGYALCSSALLADAMRKTTCVFNVPNLAQVAAIAALDDTEHLEKILAEVARGREQLTEGLVELGLAPLRSVGNFVSVKTALKAKEVAAAMFDKGIQIHAWSDPGYENFIRITVGGPEDNVACLSALSSIPGVRAA